VRETLKTKVFQWIRDACVGGLTMKEAGALYAAEKGRHPSDGSRCSCVPRIVELAGAGLASDSGRVRGRSIVWLVKGSKGDGRVRHNEEKPRWRNNHQHPALSG
jgi:hypothetical protein